MDWVNAALLIIIVIILMNIYEESWGKYGKNNIISYRGEDGIIYYIHAGHARTPEEKRESLEVLALIQQRNIQLLRYLKKNFPSDIRTKRLLDNYNPDVIMENSPKNKTGDTAYVVGKGNEFRMCIRSAYGYNPIHRDDLLTFVHLHELAHIASISYDHNYEFWHNFKWLLHRAEEAGVYTPVNYKNQPFEYCGLYVDYNPYYDRSKGEGAAAPLTPAI